MRSICLLITAAMLALTPSCTLLGSILKIPASIVKMATRTVGLTRLSDEAAQPETDGDANLGALRAPQGHVEAVGSEE